MSRPRIHDTKLPPYVRIRSGAYYFKDVKLCRVADGESAMYQALSNRTAPKVADSVPVAVESYIKTELTHLSKPARKEHERLLRVFANVFERFTVSQIRPWHMDRACKEKFASKASAAHHFKSRVSTFFRWAILRQMRTDNPCRELVLQKVIRKRTPWTDKLFLDVRDRLTPMMQCYHDLSFLLAQRATDVRLLTRAQIDDDAGVIHFEPTKTAHSSGAVVDIPITPEIREVLDRAAEISRKWGVVCPYVIHKKKGEPYTRSGVFTQYKRADEAIVGKDENRKQRQRLGLNPKAIRPYALTAAKRQGFGIEQLQVAAAHTSIETTEGYIQSHDVPVSAVVMRLPRR